MMPEPHRPAAGRCPVPHGLPGEMDGPRFSLYTREFSADPAKFYKEMRDKHGSLAPIELAPGVPATLVLGYDTALRILHDPEHFPADPRTWERFVPEDCPVLPMMRWVPAARNNTGPAHTRLRLASKVSIEAVDLYALHSTVEQLAAPLIREFCEKGTADLVHQYAFPIVTDVLNQMIGCPPELGQQIAMGMAARFDAVGAGRGGAVDPSRGMGMVTDALMQLIAHKRRVPGDDIATRLVQHSTGLDDEEVCAQLTSFLAAGVEAQGNLISNTLRLMLIDDRFGGGLLGGSLSTRDALDEVLFTDPPMANFCVTYPRQPVLIDGVWLPAHQPVVISLAACNNDPKICGGDRTGNRSHLAWSAGPHACPARTLAYQVVEDAIDHILDAIPEMDLAVPAEELEWRPGPFHRALVSLPVRFAPRRLPQPIADPTRVPGSVAV